MESLLVAMIGLASAFSTQDLIEFSSYDLFRQKEALLTLAQNHTPQDLTYMGETLLSNTSFYDAAFQVLNFSAALGDSDAYYPLGFLYMYNLSIYTQTLPSTPAALTYYYFSALAGDSRAMLALAFRHLKGIDVPMQCEAASAYYEQVARRVIAEQIDDQYVLMTEQRRIIHPWGGELSNQDENSEIREEFDIQMGGETVQGKIARASRYYYGHRGYTQNMETAFRLYQEAANMGSFPAKAALGEMYLKGRGVMQNYTQAFQLFKEAADRNIVKGKTGMGFMYLQGLGMQVNTSFGIELMKQAANLGDPNAVFNIGVLYLTGTMDGEPDLKQAFKYFNDAMHYGHTLAAYHLALMHKHSLNPYSTCNSAASLFKMIAERGVHSQTLKSAYRLYGEGQHLSSAIRYLQAADQGYEVAQVNAAYLFETFPLPVDRMKIARRMLELGAEQQEQSCILRLGDYHYYGLGVPINLDLALAYYSKAKDLRNPQALFNLAYMYQFGEGVEKDKHLAKRYYDQAISESQTVNVPANIMRYLLLRDLETTDLLMYAELLVVLLSSLYCLKLI